MLAGKPRFITAFGICIYEKSVNFVMPYPKFVPKFSNFRLGNCIELGEKNRKINGLSHFFT